MVGGVAGVKLGSLVSLLLLGLNFEIIIEKMKIEIDFFLCCMRLSFASSLCTFLFWLSHHLMSSSHFPKGRILFIIKSQITCILVLHVSL